MSFKAVGVIAVSVMLLVITAAVAVPLWLHWWNIIMEFWTK